MRTVGYVIKILSSNTQMMLPIFYMQLNNCEYEQSLTK